MAWFKGLFLDRRRFWVFATVLLTAVALRKGFRRPMMWAATQAQVDYTHGFIKRGLFGAVVTKPLHLEHYGRFAVVSTVLLLTLIGLFVLFAKRTGMIERCGSAMPLAVFGASYAVTFLGSINGYMDIPLGILTVLLLLVKSAWQRALLAVPVVIAAILIHEIFLLVFLPVVALSFVLQGVFSDSRRERGLAFGAGVGVIVLGLGITVAAAAHAPTTPRAAAAMRDEIAKRVDFQIDPMFFDVFTRSAVDNVKIMKVRSHVMFWRTAQVGSFLVLLPTAALLLGMAYRLMTLRTAGERRAPVRLALLACVVASLMPISMNLFGWDVGRWYALAGVATFLTLGMVCLHMPGPELDECAGFERAAILAIALCMAANGFLIEGQMRVYPFIGT
jgi:hypothetical protein